MTDEHILDPDLPIWDAHLHLWSHDDGHYLLEDYRRDAAAGHRIVGTTYIEGYHSYLPDGTDQWRFTGETVFASGVARCTTGSATAVAAAIVARADLTDGDSLAAALDHHAALAEGRLRGIRHVGAWDEDPALRIPYPGITEDLYARSDFRRGAAIVAARGLVLDSWQYFHQLPRLLALAQALPSLRIVVNHAGGILGVGRYTRRSDAIFAEWRGHVRALAACSNVWMKLSGFGMASTGLQSHTDMPSSATLAAAWRPYVDACIDAFGSDRCMFASNFPVDRVTCSYATLWNTYKRLAADATADDRRKLFHDTACALYRVV